MNFDDQIHKAVHYARTGHKRVAERILRSIIRQDENNSQAYYYLAGVVASEDESREYLKRCIELDPGNSKSRQILEKLNSKSEVPENPIAQNRRKRWLIAISVIFIFTLSGIALFFILHNRIGNQSKIFSTFTLTFITRTLTPQEPITPTATIPRIATNTIQSTITPFPTTDYPPAKFIENVVGQEMRISLDCEANSASILAGFFGVKIDEVEFLVSLPISDNPEKGFVGDVHDEWGNLPPKGYGVYPQPVVKLLEKKGVLAKAVYGYKLEDLKREIAAGRPVIVWVVGRVETGQPVQYTSSDGENHIVARFEHTVVVIGYNRYQLIVLDGDKIYQRPTDLFMSSWGVLGNMAIIKSNE